MPESGHKTLVAITLDPSGSPGTFTTVGFVTNPLTYKLNRESVKSIAHGDTLARTFTSPVAEIDSITVEMDYTHGDTQHDKIRDHFNLNTTFGLQITGPGAVGTDRMMFSGEALSWQVENPIGANPRKATLVFQPNLVLGYRLDGTLISN